MDIGPAGMTLAEKLAEGLKAGQPRTDGAAQQLGEGVKQKLGAVDLGPEGQRMGQSLAQGMLAAVPAVTAAAEKLAGAAKGAMAGAAGGGRFGLNNAMSAGLHDGVA